jgi:hypothetical protein
VDPPLHVSNLRVGLEPFGLLAVPDEGDDGFDVLGRESFDWWHWSELPVVGLNSSRDGEQKCPIGVVTGLVHLREERWAFFGASQIVAVALGAVRRIQVGTHFN